MSMSRYLGFARRKALGINGIYRLMRSYKSGDIVSMPFEGARDALELACPYEQPRLAEPRNDWPETPEVDVSVIVPCYNAELFLDDCLSSILSQDTSYTMELIAVDDGSSDGTGAIIDRWAERDSRVAAVHQENRGFSGARNCGIRLARGGGSRLR